MTVTNFYTEANRAAWDASAPLHGSGASWQTLLEAAAKPDFSVLDDCLTQTLIELDVHGKSAVQVGCNNGRELLSLKSLGALPALGIDQSREFLGQAEQLARIADSNCQFLCANIYELPEDTAKHFALGLITIGVLGWMPDLPEFFARVAGLLAVDAPLVIYETHPFLEMFDPNAAQAFTPATSYFTKEPFVSEAAITYDGTNGGITPSSYWFVHTMGEILTACTRAGLILERLTEHPHSNREVEYDQYERHEPQLPLSFTLVARKR